MENLKNYLPQSIEGKKILISGGTTGIGRATAIMLANAGAQIMTFGRHREDLDETMDLIRRVERPTQCYGMVADVADPGDIKRIFEAVDSQFGLLDVLINNAAIAWQGVMEGNYPDWSYVIQTNLLGYMACTYEAVNRMAAKQSGHIVNIGSMSADVREQGSSVYVASKSGIQGFSEALRKELNEKGIKVTLIEPGAVATDMQKMTAEEMEQKVNNREMLEADDIAMAVLYALSQPQRSDVVSLQIRPHLQII
jgi:NADP-dependent 3-hydroxy acid dehydrogenase YdfG